MSNWNIILGWLGTATTIWAVGDILHKVYKSVRGEKMKTLYANPYWKMLFFTVPITLLLFLVPWNKFHYGDVPTKVIYIPLAKTNSMVKMNGDTSKRRISDIPQYNPLPIKHKKQTKSTKKPISTDTSKKTSQFNLQNSTFNAPTQLGNSNNQYNNFNSERKLDDVEKNNIIKKIEIIRKSKHFKNVDIYFTLQEGVTDSRYFSEVSVFLRRVGYNIKDSQTESGNNIPFKGLQFNNFRDSLIEITVGMFEDK